MPLDSVDYASEYYISVPAIKNELYSLLAGIDTSYSCVDYQYGLIYTFVVDSCELAYLKMKYPDYQYFTVES